MYVLYVFQGQRLTDEDFLSFPFFSPLLSHLNYQFELSVYLFISGRKVKKTIQFCQLALCQPSNFSTLRFIYNMVTTLLMSHFYFSLSLGVCATLIVLKLTSIPSVLLMGNLMIMRVKSKKHHVRNRRKLKSCRWVDVKVMFILKCISKNVFSLCVETKSEDNLLGSYFISEGQF